MALVARDLSSATGLSRADFEILVRLHEAPRNTLTQRDLRESLGWSASRLSHQLERMQTRDLVTSADTGVGRLRDVRLTQHGAHEIAEAIRVHDTAVRTHFLAPLNSQQTQALNRVLQQRADDTDTGPR